MGFVIKFNDDFVTKSPDTSIVKEAPTAKVSYEFDIDADLKTDEGKELQGIITAEFAKKMKEWRTEQQKKFDEAIKWTVENYKKKKEVAAKAKELDKFTKEMEQFAETTSKLLKQGIDTMLAQVDGTANAMVKKAIETVNKKLKRKIILKKVAAVAKILVYTGIIIAATALAITATVLTAGAAAPLIIGVIAAAVPAVKKIVDTANKAWPSQEKAKATLSANLQAYVKAYAYEMKKQDDELTRTLGLKERAKRALNSVSGARKDAIVALKDFEVWTNNLKIAIEMMAQKAGGFSDQIDKLSKEAGALKKSKEFMALDLADKKMAIAVGRLRNEIAEVNKVIAEVKTAVAAEQPDEQAVNKIVGKLKSFSNEPLVKDVMEGFSLLTACITPAKKVFAAV